MVSESFAFPLSFAQQRLWFLDRLAPGNPFYNIPIAVPVSASLNVRTLEHALNAVVARHEALRTTFRVIDGEPAQVVQSSLELQVDMIDLRRMSPVERETRTLQLATEEARRPFDLERGPLVRCTVIKRGLLDHVLLLTMHHIVSDGWSMGTLAEELTTFYQSIQLGRANELPELAIQYPDFAVWQREWMAGDVLRGELSYWLKQLAELPILDLPTDRQRPPVLTFSGGFHPVELTSQLSARVRSTARQSNATPFIVMLAAFAALMQRYSGQHDMVIGSPVANRTRPELEGLIGFFVNSLVLRIDMAGDPTFLELLQRVRNVALDAFAHQDLPFEKLVEELQLPRDPSRNPLFQVTFQLVNIPTLTQASGRRGHPPLNVQRGAAIFDIAFTLLDDPSRFRGIFEYSTDLFDAATIERMDRHFQRLLEGVLDSPRVPVSKLPLLTADERMERISAARGLRGDDDALHGSPVHQIVAVQADRTPGAIAVQAGEVALTYADLRGRWRRLARHLRELGIGAETCVGVCMDRSIDSVVALLAIFEAGGTYLPLDPSYPKARIHFMARDAGAAFILTHKQYAGAGGILEDCPVRLVTLDGHAEALAALPDEPSAGPAGGDSLAYIIYTSGSTGQPKGVGIPHKALANHMRWMLAAFEFQASDRVLQRTPASFDASMWEYFAPLMVGGRLVLLPQEAQRDPHAIVRAIARHEVTVLQVVPALLRMLLDEPEFFMCSSLRYLFAGGEALTEDLRAQVLGAIDVTLVNLYGPTEATIDTTFHICNRDAQPLGVPLGRPITNASAYVLDQNLEPLPVGMPGDLYIGGGCLARGYVNHPAQTAERFIPDPFADVPGVRMYHTGDRARRLANGDLLFLGRSDQQVKVRGYRIEPEEIESAIREIPGVQDCAVVADAAPEGGSLTAFVVPLIAPGPDGLDIDTAALAQQHVDHWEQLYARVYAGEALATDLDFNTVGWNDSYTGAPFSDVEMADWRDGTVRRIQRLAPRNALEIGCGAGLLLSQLAPACMRYVGTDFAPAVLQAIEEQLQDRVDAGQVALLARRADDFRGIEPQSYDTIILNSVVQYFPGMDYLVEVLRGAVAAAAPGGSVFIGDVRSLPLIEAFHASVVLRSAPMHAAAGTLRQRVRSRLAHDPELVIDPGFFCAFAAQHTRVTGVEVWLKRSHYLNELTRFRYDVILHVEREPLPSRGAVLDWQSEQLTPERLSGLVAREKPECLTITGVPNARVARDVTLVSLMNEAPPQAKLSDLHEAVEHLTRNAVDPACIWQIAEACGYEARLRFAAPPRSHCFDALFWRGSAAAPGDPLPIACSEQPFAWHNSGNNPLRAALTRSFVPRLQEKLSARFPEYMVPSAFVLLDALPLLPNGKLDRAALRQHFAERAGAAGGYVAPRTPLEESVAAIWADTLDLKRVGVHDNFFTELGGHSLLATQLISRIRQALQIDVPLKQIFAAPTVESFAASLSEEAYIDQRTLAQAAASISNASRMSDADLQRSLPQHQLVGL